MPEGITHSLKEEGEFCCVLDVDKSSYDRKKVPDDKSVFGVLDRTGKSISLESPARGHCFLITPDDQLIELEGPAVVKPKNKTVISLKKIQRDNRGITLEEIVHAFNSICRRDSREYGDFDDDYDDESGRSYYYPPDSSSSSSITISPLKKDYSSEYENDKSEERKVTRIVYYKALKIWSYVIIICDQA